MVVVVVVGAGGWIKKGKRGGGEEGEGWWGCAIAMHYFKPSHHRCFLHMRELGEACSSRLFKAEPRGRERHRVAFKCILDFFGTVQISQTAVMLSPTPKKKKKKAAARI